jgi:hypothetical protein
MIGYFIEQDVGHLEKKNWEGWKIDQACPICNDGHLYRPGAKEDDGIRKTDFFRCDYCDSEFRNYRLDT